MGLFCGVRTHRVGLARMHGWNRTCNQTIYQSIGAFYRALWTRLSLGGGRRAGKGGNQSGCSPHPPAAQHLSKLVMNWGLCAGLDQGLPEFIKEMVPEERRRVVLVAKRSSPRLLAKPRDAASRRNFSPSRTSTRRRFNDRGVGWIGWKRVPWPACLPQLDRPSRPTGNR